VPNGGGAALKIRRHDRPPAPEAPAHEHRAGIDKRGKPLLDHDAIKLQRRELSNKRGGRHDLLTPGSAPKDCRCHHRADGEQADNNGGTSS
jgi:hypothetical protein